MSRLSHEGTAQIRTGRPFVRAGDSVRNRLAVSVVAWPEQVHSISAQAKLLRSLVLRFHVDKRSSNASYPYEYAKAERTYLERWIWDNSVGTLAAPTGILPRVPSFFPSCSLRVLSDYLTTLSGYDPPGLQAGRLPREAVMATAPDGLVE